MVDFDASVGLVAKTTIPTGFGLVPEVHRHSLAVLRPDSNAPRHGDAIEFVLATPLEYLARWLYCNEVFGDDVRLVSVIRWAEWTRLNDSSGHTVFFDYAIGVLAIDAEKRNCYFNAGGLQPFDVVLCKPDEALERYLGIYPESRD